MKHHRCKPAILYIQGEKRRTRINDYFDRYHGYKKTISISIKKKACLFVVYPFGPCRSQRNQNLHSLVLHSGQGRGLLFDQKFWPPGYLVFQFWHFLTFCRHSQLRLKYSIIIGGHKKRQDLAVVKRVRCNE
jgi:hypothetical protein